MPEGAYPPPFYPDPLLSNVNFRPMPDDENYFEGVAEGYESPADLYSEVPPPFLQDSDEQPNQDEGESQPDPTEAPIVEKPPVLRDLSKPENLSAEVVDGKLRLSASVPEGEDVHKLVFHVDGKQAAVCDDDGGAATVDVTVEPGEHKVRAFTYTGTRSGPWSETITVVV